MADEIGERGFLWYRWETGGDDACPTCKSRNGTKSRRRRGKAHPNCQCKEVEDWRWCKLVGRTFLGTVVETELQEIGVLVAGASGHYSHGESSSVGVGVGAGGVSGSISGSESSESKTVFTNDSDSTWLIYAMYEITWDEWLDLWDCVGTDDNENIVRKDNYTKKFMGHTYEDLGA